MGILQKMSEIKSLAKKMKDDNNRPSFVDTPMYKNNSRIKQHKEKRGIKAKMASKMP